MWQVKTLLDNFAVTSAYRTEGIRTETILLSVAHVQFVATSSRINRVKYCPHAVRTYTMESIQTE